MARWDFRAQGACGIEVTGELLLPEDADGMCRVKIVKVAGHPQRMGFVPRATWGRFRSPRHLETALRGRGWRLARTDRAGAGGRTVSTPGTSPRTLASTHHEHVNRR